MTASDFFILSIQKKSKTGDCCNLRKLQFPWLNLEILFAIYWGGKKINGQKEM
jgi:hypothetical protein